MPIEYNDRDYFPLKSSAAAIFRRSKVTAVLPHFHAFDELIFVVAGSGRHVVNGTIFDFEAGDVLLVPSGSCHHYRNILGLSIVSVLLRPRYLTGFTIRNAYEAVSGLSDGLPDQVRPSARLFSHMAEWIGMIESRQWPECEPELTLLLHAVTASDCVKPETTVGQMLQSSIEQRLAPALRHLEFNFAQEDALRPICDLVHMSSRTLLRRFHEITGRSPVGYLADLRLHHAMLELRRDKRSILEIAMAAGFNDLSYFHRRFQQATGLTPHRWRRNPAHVW
jgi:AraC-like DNA-binding protein